MEKDAIKTIHDVIFSLYQRKEDSKGRDIAPWHEAFVTEYCSILYKGKKVAHRVLTYCIFLEAQNALGWKERLKVI